MPNPGFWTLERTARLRAYWRTKRSASEIAKLMGCTKNAIIGKVHRLELPPRREGTPRAR